MENFATLAYCFGIRILRARNCTQRSQTCAIARHYHCRMCLSPRAKVFVLAMCFVGMAAWLVGSTLNLDWLADLGGILTVPLTVLMGGAVVLYAIIALCAVFLRLASRVRHRRWH